MKINHVFIMGTIGGVCLGYPTALRAGGDEAEHPQHITIPRAKNILPFFKRSPSHSSSITMSSDRQSDVIVGSLDSTRSVSSSSSSGISSPSSQSSSGKAGNRLLHVMRRFSTRRAQSEVVNGRSELLMVEDVQMIDKEDPTQKASFIFDTMDNQDIFEKTGWVLRCIGEGVPAIFTESENVLDTREMGEIDALIATLDDISDKIQTYQKRAVEDFVDSYIDSLKTNFKNVKAPGQEIEFDPKSVYSFLNINDPISTSNNEVRKRIKEHESGNPGHPSFFRQLEYPFRNHFSKQDYDAYLAGDDALKKLMIDKSHQTPLTFLAHFAIVCKNGLREYKRENEAGSASQHSLRSPGLADQALNFDMTSN